MKYKFLRSASFLASVLLLLLVSSCLKKNDATFTDFSSTQPYVLLQNAGLSSFNNVAFNRGSDTVRYDILVDYASATNPSSPVTVTLGVNTDAITSYNASNPQPGYIVLPTANFKLLTPTVTIPAGQHYATAKLEIYTKGLDPAASYMIPVSILDAGNTNKSSNLNTIYYHSIGNPLAGAYTWLGQRWNSNTGNGLDTTKAQASTPQNNTTVSISPLGPTTLFFPNVYLKQNGVDAGVSLSFTNTAGVLSNFTAKLYDPAGGIGAVGFSVVTNPVLVGYKIVGNVATKYAGSVFRFYAVFDNGSGAQRATIDTYTKQ